ncbi:mevalonate kinase [Lactobacillus colini]|uniref:Mevalonate kinase n=1 Tax=Lactobacillus colini TaxID=1819254 RepID=A0ABS4MCF8_9LACO|nr:mevalonate kinase [Lactobacillus colini]MBP2057077.1 mevalonate kinase [Lactobacillus colini]
MNNKKISITTHGKVILIGEHSVVYGKDALALPIKGLNIITTIEKSPTAESIMITNHYQGPYLQSPSEYDGLKYVFNTLNSLAKNSEPLQVTYTGEIPMERGLGSSAVVALGTTKALNNYFNLMLPEEKIMEITNHAEMINHGKASGLDAATVNSDYVVFFNKKIGPHPISKKLGATLLIMDTGELGNTKRAVKLVRDKIESNPNEAKKIERLGVLATKTKDLWGKQDVSAIGQIFNEAEEILASFGIATKRIEEISKIAQVNGALGTKLSGGGLGGIVIALCNDKYTAEKIAQKAKDNFSNYWIEEI